MAGIYEKSKISQSTHRRAYRPSRNPGDATAFDHLRCLIDGQEVNEPDIRPHGRPQLVRVEPIASWVVRSCELTNYYCRALEAQQTRTPCICRAHLAVASRSSSSLRQLPIIDTRGRGHRRIHDARRRCRQEILAIRTSFRIRQQLNTINNRPL